MYADDTKVKMADGTEKFIRLLNVGDKVALYGSNLTATLTKVTEVYNDTYAVVCNNNGVKKALYCTLDQPLLLANGETIEAGAMRIGSVLANVGKVFGLVESGERRTFAITTDKGGNIYVNDFIGG